MTDLEVYRQPTAELAVAQDIDSWTQVAGQVIKLANEIYDTPFVPDGLRGSVPATAAAILAGRELGLGPMTSLANVHVIKGKPALSAALMRALILAQGHQIETLDISDTRCVIRGRRRGESTWEEAQFTADQAKRAGIVLGGYPQDKLYARATSRLARRKFADVIAGMPYSAEELEDGTGDQGQPEPPPQDQKPAARTARRARAATQDASPADAAPTAPASTAATPPRRPATPTRAAGEAPLPPLPGEDEPDPTAPTAGTQDASSARPGTDEPDERDYDSPGTVTTPQITAIWTVLSKVFSFGSDEKDQARAVCTHITGRVLASTKDMSKNEAKAVLDTLASWQQLAEGNSMTPREMLTQLMVAAAEAGDAPENGDQQ